MKIRQRIVMRLLGVKQVVDDQNHMVRVTIPRKRAKIVPKLVDNLKASAWRDGYELTTMNIGDETRLMHEDVTIIIKVV